MERDRRHFGLDWLRIGAFAILIFYHAALPFGVSPWLIQVERPSSFVDLLLAAVQPWRMALLFVVSGYATHRLLERSGGPGEFLRRRASRLLPPLLLGMVFLAAPETWIGAVEHHGYRAGFLAFWRDEWVPGSNGFAGEIPNPEHLWFLAYLMTYTAALAAAVALVPARARGVAARLIDRWVAKPRRFWLPLLPLLVLRAALLFTVPEQRGLLHDWVSDLLFVPAFLFGFLLAARPELWRAIARTRRAAAILALASLSLLLAIEGTYPVQAPHLVQLLDREAQLAMQWSMILLLLGLADRFLDRDMAWRARLNEAVFPLYLVHQTIVVLLVWKLRGQVDSQAALYGLVVAGTFAGAWLFYALARRTGPLRPLFGLAAVRRRTRADPRPGVEPVPAQLPS